MNLDHDITSSYVRRVRCSIASTSRFHRFVQGHQNHHARLARHARSAGWLRRRWAPAPAERAPSVAAANPASRAARPHSAPCFRSSCSDTSKAERGRETRTRALKKQRGREPPRRVASGKAKRSGGPAPSVATRPTFPFRVGVLQRAGRVPTCGGACACLPAPGRRRTLSALPGYRPWPVGLSLWPGGLAQLLGRDGQRQRCRCRCRWPRPRTTPTRRLPACGLVYA